MKKALISLFLLLPLLMYSQSPYLIGDGSIIGDGTLVGDFSTNPCDTVTITASASIVADTNNQGVGSIDLTPGGNGSTPYSFLWSSGETTEDLTGKASGNYTVTITTNVDTCTSDFVYNIPLIQDCGLITINPIATITADTSNSGVGSIELSIEGNGVAPFVYYWIPDGETTQSIFNKQAGAYAVTVTDVNGCTGDGLYSLPNFEPPTCIPYSISSIVVNETNGQRDGSITQAISGNNTPYTYLWSSGETTQNISGKAAGVYTVQITSSNDCDTTVSYTINAITDVCNGITITSNAVVYPDTSSRSVGGINQTIGGNGFPPYSYVWSNGSTTQDIYNLPANTYTVTVSDANGCTGTRSYQVRNYIKPITFKGRAKVINGTLIAPRNTLIITK